MNDFLEQSWDMVPKKREETPSKIRNVVYISQRIATEDDGHRVMPMLGERKNDFNLLSVYPSTTDK